MRRKLTISIVFLLLGFTMAGVAIFADMYGREGSIGIGEGSVWAVTENDRLLERFDPQSGAVQVKISLPSAGAGVLVDYGSAWVTAPLS
jgi:streptogramin lyase